MKQEFKQACCLFVRDACIVVKPSYRITAICGTNFDHLCSPFSQTEVLTKLPNTCITNYSQTTLVSSMVTIDSLLVFPSALSNDTMVDFLRMPVFSEYVSVPPSPPKQHGQTVSAEMLLLTDYSRSLTPYLTLSLHTLSFHNKEKY